MKIYEEKFKKHFEGLTAREIANSLKITDSTLSKLFCGSRRLGVQVGKKIVNAVGAKIANELIDWEGLPCLQT